MTSAQTASCVCCTVGLQYLHGHTTLVLLYCLLMRPVTPHTVFSLCHTFCHSLEEAKVGYDQLAHYGTIPYEALYEGYFPTVNAART